MINKAKIKKKYPFKQMQPGEAFKLDDEDVRRAQKMAWYYRARCKRPIRIVIMLCRLRVILLYKCVGEQRKFKNEFRRHAGAFLAEFGTPLIRFPPIAGCPSYF